MHLTDNQKKGAVAGSLVAVAVFLQQAFCYLYSNGWIEKLAEAICK